MAIARIHDGSVSNVISITNSDSNSFINNPLEKELNLTEYELRIRAANGFADQMSVEEEIGTTGVFKRISNTYATDAGSENTSQMHRRRTENFTSVKSKEVDEFVMQHGELKRSLQEPSLLHSTIQPGYGDEV